VRSGQNVGKNKRSSCHCAIVAGRAQGTHHGASHSGERLRRSGFDEANFNLPIGQARRVHASKPESVREEYGIMERERRGWLIVAVPFVVLVLCTGRF
jgi:hypothetical protein